MPVSKNPFSLYDFLGYFVPGAFMLFALMVASNDNKELVRVIGDIDMDSVSKICDLKMDSISVLLFAIVSYIIGHFLSYTSSITIELLSNRLFQYPSKYLLKIKGEECNECKEKRHGVFQRLFLGKGFWGGLLLVISFVVCMPVSLPMLVFAHCECINNYLTRPLDKEWINAIKNKLQLYACMIGECTSFDCPQCDSHLMIMHYVNINVPNATRKVDNYVALYGFLRSMSMALSILFIMVSFSSLNAVKTGAAIDRNIICTLCVLALAPIVAYLAYLKFYRRHTLENLMAFLVAPGLEAQIVEEPIKEPIENIKKNEKQLSVGVSLFARRE